MNTKNILMALGAVSVIILIVLATKSKKDDAMTEPQIDPVTGEVILGTGGPDDETIDPMTGEPKDPSMTNAGCAPIENGMISCDLFRTE